MKGRSRSVTLVIQQDGAVRSQTLRIPLWALRLGLTFGAILLAGLLLVAILYLPVVRAAARVPGLERQVTRLESDNAKIRQLSSALDSLESRYAQVRQMIGADVMRDPLALASPLPLAPALRARAAGAESRGPSFGLTLPREWPLDETGYVTQGQVGGGSREEAHPGIDIAVSVGAIVRASGGATVHQVGEDPEYGFFVLLDHPEEYQTMYGHLSRIIVTAGATVAPSEVIGLSGNSGRSTAPHLHFEIRQRGTSLDPRAMVREGE
ncbi:MAG: M23 family metallopeptidase [Gemmatimonadales bacterium]